jgi:hypothetical protein
LLQVVHQWPGLPKGVKFDPSDQELIWHLRAKHGKSGIKPHPSIDEFIPTVEEDEGICYTHLCPFQVLSKMEVYHISSTEHLRPTTLGLGSVER